MATSNTEGTQVESDHTDLDDATEAVEATTQDEYDTDDVHHDVYEEHDERHPSLAARLLTWLILLIAGAGLALWGGPKIAPQLPEWAEPAAKFLTPGGTLAQSEVDALRSEIEPRLTAAEAGPDMGAVETLIDSKIAEMATQSDAQIKALADQLAATDGSDIEGRLAQVETRVEGVSAQIEALNASVTASLENGSGISEEALAQIAAKTGEVDGIRAEVGQISQQVGALSQRIDDVASAAERRVEEAETSAAAIVTSAELQEAIAVLSSKTATGAPYQEELDVLIALDAVEVPEALGTLAGSGVPTLKSLQAEFQDVSFAALRSSVKEQATEDGGAMSRVGAFFKSQVVVRSLEPKEGDSTDAILSRIGSALTEGDLNSILVEAEALSAAPRDVLSGWLDKVSARKSVNEALSALSSQQS